MKEINGFPNHLITKEGEVFNKQGKKYKPTKTKQGYMQIKLCNGIYKKHYYIHRLVAEAFIPNPKNKPAVNHIDFDKTNNNVDNLEWCSTKENNDWGWKNHRYENSRKLTSLLGKKYGGRFKKKVVCIDNNMIFESMTAACKWAGIKSTSNISNAIKNNTRAKGYHWKYQ